MNSHSHHFPLTRLFTAIIAAFALSLMLMTTSAFALTPSDLAFTSTAPSNVKYGDTVAYTPTATTASTSTVVISIDSGSSAVCKITAGVVSVTGAGTCKVNAHADADATYDVGDVSQSFSVAKVPLTVTASSSSNFYGGNIPAIAAFYSGFVNGDSSSKLKTKPTCATTAIVVSNPGVYPTNCKSAASDNYTFTYVDGTYSVSQAPLLLVPSATVKLGKKLKSITLTGYGWQGWDDEFSNDINGKPKCKLPNAAKKKPGVYKLSCTNGNLSSLNYAFTLVPGFVTVKKK